MKNNLQLSPDQDDFFSFDDLPDGWKCKKLGEIVSPSKEKIEPTADSTLPYIGLEHIESNTSKIIGQAVASDAKSTKTVFHSGDVLYGKLRPYLNKVAIPDFDGICSTDILVFNQNQMIDSRYLMRYLTTGDVVEYANLKSKGLSLPRVSFESLSEILIPLPTLSKQQHIVARVEALLTHINAARDRLSRVPLIMKKFRQAVLAAACSGRLTEGWREENPDVEPANGLISKILDERKLWYNSEFNKAKLDGSKKPKKAKFLRKETTSEELISDLPASWDICFFEDIAANLENAIKAGPFGSSLTKSCHTKSGYKIYGQEQVIKGDPAYGDYWISEEKYHELESCKVKPDDILISLVGTVGKVLILPKDCKAGIINPRLVKLSIDPKISKQYVKNYLESPLAKNRLFGDSHGGTMEILNLEILKNLPIPLPPVAEQHEIVRRVGLLFERADAFDLEVAAAGRRCERLTQAVLGKAFRGELVSR